MDSNKMTIDSKFVKVGSIIAKYLVFIVGFSLLNLFTVFMLLFLSIIVTRLYFSNKFSLLESIQKAFVLRNIWRSIVGGILIFFCVYYFQSSLYNSLFLNNSIILYVSIIVLVYASFLCYSGTIIYSNMLMDGSNISFIKAIQQIPNNFKYLFVTFCVCISLLAAMFFALSGYALVFYFSVFVVEIKLQNAYLKELQND